MPFKNTGKSKWPPIQSGACISLNLQIPNTLQPHFSLVTLFTILFTRYIHFSEHESVPERHRLRTAPESTGQLSVIVNLCISLVSVAQIKCTVYRQKYFSVAGCFSKFAIQASCFLTNYHLPIQLQMKVYGGDLKIGGTVFNLSPFRMKSQLKML